MWIIANVGILSLNFRYQAVLTDILDAKFENRHVWILFYGSYFSMILYINYSLVCVFNGYVYLYFYIYIYIYSLKLKCWGAVSFKTARKAIGNPLVNYLWYVNSYLLICMFRTIWFWCIWTNFIHICIL